jgi:tetratricopeptide (TPR) repeat protein
MRLDSSRPDFVLEEASIFLASKDYEAARARALRVQRMDAESGQSLLIVGDAYLGEKKWDKAREYYEKCRKYDDAEAISHYKLAKLFLRQPKPDPDQAQAELELATSSLSQIGERRLAAESAVMLAKLYINKNRAGEFVAIVKKAMLIDPSYAPPYALIAINTDQNTADGKAAAKEGCEKNLALDPRNAYAETCRKLLKQLK